MKCYICDRTQQPGGMHYDVRQAVGICQHCGIGVCLEHSHKDAELGAPLLCPSCARLLNEGAHRQSATATVSQARQR
jgi:hypothetical protein